MQPDEIRDELAEAIRSVLDEVDPDTMTTEALLELLVDTVMLTLRHAESA